MSNGIISVFVAWLLGGIPTGLLLMRWFRGVDVRQQGSGNIGATNVLRTGGKGLGIATLLIDIGKAVLAVWLAGRATDQDPLWSSLAALACLVGHAFSVWLRFQGGKAVASYAGAWAWLTPLPMLCVMLIFIAVVWRTRFVSLGALIGALLFPLAVFLILHPPAIMNICAVLCSALVILRHRSNIDRLRAGTENKLSLSSRA
jgi:acyl phosphate:glycerol-3-phosphate acyltransferase